MPRGAYAVGGGREEFSCAADAVGWRYVSAGLELTLDGAGRQLRAEFRAGGWTVRGGVAGPATTWVRDGVEHSAAASGFAGESPGLLVAASRLLRLAPGERSRLRLVLVSGAALATRVVEQGWELVGTSEHGELQVARYRVVALDTGEVAEVHLAGDVVLAAPGIELTELSSAPAR